MSAAAPLVEGTSLACLRGERLLWRGVGFALHPSEALHVRGANGIGKSSLLRIVAGLLPPAAGEVQRHAAMGMIADAAALEADRPLGRALAWWARLDGVPSDRAAAAAERLGVARLAEVPVRYLSTGQRRRAALARLIAQAPAVWLLDEAANGLDRDGVALLEALIAEHRSSGGAVLYTSHQALAVPGAAMLDLAGHRVELAA